MGLIFGAYGGGTIVGKVGNTVFQRGPFGNVIRAYVVPVNPASVRQETVRLEMESSVQRWSQLLTDMKRAEWEDYAKATPIGQPPGPPKFLSGRQHYIRSNMAIVLSGGAAILDAPDTPGVAANIQALISGDTAGGLKFTGSDPGLSAGVEAIYVQLSPALNQTRNFWKGPYTKTFVFNGSEVLPFEMIPPAQVAIGQRWHFRWRFANFATRKISTLAYGLADITA